MTSQATIFGLEERTDATPRKNSESTYAFLCRVAGPFWDQCRALINSWIAEYPLPHRSAITSRLKTGNDRDFASAFWELYLHEMYRRDGWSIEIEPDVPGVSTRPDFLVSRGGISYYVEARCVFEGVDAGAAARLETVYDAVNRINSGDFHLEVTTVRIGSLAPKTRKLQSDLEKWLSSLDPDAGDYKLRDKRSERRFEWKSDDWHVVFRPMPRKSEVRGTPVRRAIGAYIPADASFIDDLGPFKGALREKGSKYGELPHPLVVAINVARDFHDDEDTAQALYGTIGWRINIDDPEADAIPVITEVGYWGSAASPAHTNVAGVLLAQEFHYGQVARYAPAYWAHPYALEPVDPLETWRVAVPGSDDWEYSEPPVPPHLHFALPEGWPIGERFPR